MITSSQRAIDTAAFTDRTDFPLVVVTTIGPDGELSGCLAGFTTQCSIEPVRFLVCISRVNHTFDVITRSTVMALHLLGEDQADTASLFGELSGDQVDKFDDLGWHPGPAGVPVLDECVAWMAAGIIGRFDVGDHEAQFIYPMDARAGTSTGLLTRASAPDLQPAHPVD
jgi:flavin reductase (DIM6/NTAB) family NADH-FMN oxidoreductase RutF